MGRPKYLLVKGRAGLGNRLLAALTGIRYARLSGRRLVVDWRDESYSDDGTDAFPRFFDCPASGSTDEVPSTESVTPTIWRGRLDESVMELRRALGDLPKAGFHRRTSVDLTRLDHDHDVAVMWLFEERVDQLRIHARRSEWRRSTNAILTQLLREEVHLRPEIQARVDGFRDDRFSGPMVGVHVRYSDRQVRLDAIVRRVDALIEREPGLRVFLATDNRAVADRFERRYREIVTTPHWYPEPGSHSHQSADCPDRLENGVEALVDLFLLAECEYLVCDSASSFARVATLLTSAPATHISDVGPDARLRRRLRNGAVRLAPELIGARERAAGLMQATPKLPRRSP